MLFREADLAETHPRKRRGGLLHQQRHPLRTILRFHSCSWSCSCSGTALPSTLAAGSETRTWFAADGWSALHEQEQEQEINRDRSRIAASSYGTQLLIELQTATWTC